MPYIRIKFKREKSARRLHLPIRYQSDQWLQEVCETLEDADEVEFADYSIKQEK